MPSRWSTRHGVGHDEVSFTDKDSLAKAMRRKAVANLNFTCMNKSSKSFLAFPRPLITANLNNVGFSLGNSS
jgi:hypothetical protein